MSYKIRNWLYPLLAILAAITIGFSIYNYKTMANHYEDCTKAASEAAFNDIMLNKVIDPKYLAVETSQNRKIITDKINCSNLSAQWAMSDIAMLGYIAGLVGLLFLGVTVYETKRAADMTRDALNITRNTAIKQLRAYISLDPIIDLLPKTPTTNAFIKVTIRNGGQTPAYNLRVNHTWAQLKSDNWQTKNPSNENLQDGMIQDKIINKCEATDCSLSHLGSGGTSFCDIHAPTFNNTLVRNGHVDIVLVIRINFMDIYKTKRMSEHFFLSHKLGNLEEKCSYQHETDTS